MKQYKNSYVGKSAFIYGFFQSKDTNKELSPITSSIARYADALANVICSAEDNNNHCPSESDLALAWELLSILDHAKEAVISGFAEGEKWTK